MFHVLITRPEPANSEFAQMLMREFGPAVQITKSPIMEIVGVDPGDVGGHDAVIFTSSNAVRFAPQLPRGTRAFCVGEETTARAAAAGFAAAQLGADARALVATLSLTQPKGRILYLRGNHSAGDIAGALDDAGLNITERQCYAQMDRALTDDAHKLLDREEPVFLPLFSARSAALICAVEQDWGRHIAVTLSHAVASPCIPAKFAQLVVASKPSAKGMISALREAFQIGR